MMTIKKYAPQDEEEPQTQTWLSLHDGYPDHQLRYCFKESCLNIWWIDILGYQIEERWEDLFKKKKARVL